MGAKLWDMSHLFVCFVALVIQGGAMAKFGNGHLARNINIGNICANYTMNNQGYKTHKEMGHVP